MKGSPAAQVSCGPAFTHTELKPTWLSTSSNHWGGGHQPSMGGVINQLWGGHPPRMGGSSTNYGRGVISQVMGGSSTNYGGVISQVWGGHQPTMGGSSAKYGGVINQLWEGVISQVWGGHQLTMGGVSPSMYRKSKSRESSTHTSCRL